MIKYENNLLKYIVCGETRTHDLNLDSHTLYPKVKRDSDEYMIRKYTTLK